MEDRDEKKPPVWGYHVHPVRAQAGRPPRGLGAGSPVRRLLKAAGKSCNRLFPVVSYT